MRNRYTTIKGDALDCLVAVMMWNWHWGDNPNHCDKTHDDTYTAVKTIAGAM